MLKHFILPLAAICLSVTSVQAAVVIRDAVSVPMGGAPGTGGEVDSPGDPFYPDSSRRATTTDDASTGDTPTLRPQKKKTGIDPVATGSIGGARSDCGSDLGNLRKVTASSVRAVGYGDNIDIIPLCVGRSIADTQFRVEQLHAPIAQNETLTSALRMKGYDSSQVVGVVIADQLVVLYVH
jgi:hypothetical protein